MTFSVRVLPKAADDAEHIFRWIAARSPAGAARWYEAFDAAVASLRTNALHHGFAPENSRLNAAVRETFFKTRRGRKYRLVFTVRESDVFVLRVRGPGQPPITKPMIGE